MLEVPAPNCTTLTKGAASCVDVFRALDELGFEPEDGIGVDAAHKEGVGLARGFTCADVPWAKWHSPSSQHFPVLKKCLQILVL